MTTDELKTREQVNEEIQEKFRCFLSHELEKLLRDVIDSDLTKLLYLKGKIDFINGQLSENYDFEVSVNTIHKLEDAGELP